VLGNTPAPSTSIDACLWDGFHLDSGVKITGGTGVLLVAGEAFAWRPWETKGDLKLVNEKGQWEVGDEAWGLLGLVWPKPGMLCFILLLLSVSIGDSKMCEAAEEGANCHRRFVNPRPWEGDAADISADETVH